jgi:hypothetical protein
MIQTWPMMFSELQKGGRSDVSIEKIERRLPSCRVSCECGVESRAFDFDRD